VVGWVRIPARPTPSDIVSVTSVLLTDALAAAAPTGDRATDTLEASRVSAARAAAVLRGLRGLRERVVLRRKGTVDLREVTEE
jgi:hypothetical protein